MFLECGIEDDREEDEYRMCSTAVIYLHPLGGGYRPLTSDYTPLVTHYRHTPSRVSIPSLYTELTVLPAVLEL